MPDTHPPRRSLFSVWRWPRWTWAVVVPLLLIAYPLGYGPFVRFFNNFPPEVQPIVARIYYPLVVLLSHCKPLNNLVTWYVGLWFRI